MREARDIILKPMVSEKSYDLVSEKKYTFKVDPRATKLAVRKAVEEIFKVHVTKVNTVRMRGKRKRQGYTSGRRPDWKKAVVTLREGEKIEIFEGT